MLGVVLASWAVPAAAGLIVVLLFTVVAFLVFRKKRDAKINFPVSRAKLDFRVCDKAVDHYDDWKGDTREALACLWLASQGWLQVRSKHDSKHGLDGIFVKRVDGGSLVDCQSGGFQSVWVLILEVKGTIGDAKKQLTTEWIVDRLQELGKKCASEEMKTFYERLEEEVKSPNKRSRIGRAACGVNFDDPRKRNMKIEWVECSEDFPSVEPEVSLSWEKVQALQIALLRPGQKLTMSAMDPAIRSASEGEKAG